uniref:Uncharacterized protein n=1 Tax=Desmodus rotundus TaxID=9430 RepID=K9IG65_DESRO
MLTYHLYVFGDVQIFCTFLNCVVFLVLNFRSILCILHNSPLSEMYFASVFFLSSFFLIVSLTERLLILMKSSLPVFSFMDQAFGIVSLKSFSNPRSPRFCHVLFSRSFAFYI